MDAHKESEGWKGEDRERNKVGWLVGEKERWKQGKDRWGVSGKGNSGGGEMRCTPRSPGAPHFLDVICTGVSVFIGLADFVVVLQ